MEQARQPIRVVFQGDSVTDCGRGRFHDTDLGNGYAMMAAAHFGAQFPEKQVQFFNRGISGDRVRDLHARWEEDCLSLQPDWVSILIGINDTWRRYDQHDPTPVAAFAATYRTMLEATAAQGARLIMCEPFLLPVSTEQMAWREDLDPKIAVARQLAQEYQAWFIPLDGLFAQAATRRQPAFWADDGVHPTPAGHALIARAWLETFTSALAVS
ncbi:MAG TPA: SGNH/GDSL hydrolase family protein [Ktedonobacterales bacterium]|nr:SGNH/GDSL hydrolase family protein [Ktedonobacterales bacterium]